MRRKRSENVFVTKYPDVIADPIATVETIYKAAGRTLTAEAKQAMKDQLANNKQVSKNDDVKNRHTFCSVHLDTNSSLLPPPSLVARLQHKHGKASYSLEKFGLTKERLDNAMSAYREAFLV